LLQLALVELARLILNVTPPPKRGFFVGFSGSSRDLPAWIFLSFLQPARGIALCC